MEFAADARPVSAAQQELGHLPWSSVCWEVLLGSWISLDSSAVAAVVLFVACLLWKEKPHHLVAKERKLFSWENEPSALVELEHLIS